MCYLEHIIHIFIFRELAVSREKHIIFVPGAFAPLTTDGNIIIDGVLASCYADVDHDLSHLLMIPMCWCKEAVEWIFGFDTGFPVHISIVRELSTLLLPEGHYWSY